MYFFMDWWSLSTKKNMKKHTDVVNPINNPIKSRYIDG